MFIIQMRIADSDDLAAIFTLTDAFTRVDAGACDPAANLLSSQRSTRSVHSANRKRGSERQSQNCGRTTSFGRSKNPIWQQIASIETWTEIDGCLICWSHFPLGDLTSLPYKGVSDQRGRPPSLASG